MNPAGGLNLNDIILPPPVGWWPPAPGWWIVAALLMVLPLLLFLLWRWRLRLRIRRLPGRQCRQQLSGLAAGQPALTPELCRSINETLKRYCRSRYPRALVLYGPAWAEFLQQSGNMNPQQSELLASGPYLPAAQLSGDATALLRASQDWLQHAERHRRATDA